MRLMPVQKSPGRVRHTAGRRPRDVKPIALALQGGGSHGAFQWGVLEELLDCPRLRIDAVSGTSAGAMNAAMLVQGLAQGGRPRARELLAEFWRRVASAFGVPELRTLPWPWSIDGFLEVVQRTSRVFAPMGASAGSNPLRSILDDLLDPAAIGNATAPTLVVSATRVRTGEARLFRGQEVTVDALLASACLPQLFPAVEIDGETFWDGGYSSNPPLRPLIEAGAPSDVVLITTMPLEQPEPPAGRAEVTTRAAELAFGTAMRQELRSLAVAQQLIADLPFVPHALARLRDARPHLIVAERELQALKGYRRLDASWPFLAELRDLGRATARRWLDANLAALGRRPTLDLGQFAEPTMTAEITPRQKVA